MLSNCQCAAIELEVEVEGREILLGTLDPDCGHQWQPQKELDHWPPTHTSWIDCPCALHCDTMQVASKDSTALTTVCSYMFVGT